MVGGSSLLVAIVPYRGWDPLSFQLSNNLEGVLHRHAEKSVRAPVSCLPQAEEDWGTESTYGEEIWFSYFLRTAK